jgi:hypothetical protein
MTAVEWLIDELTDNGIEYLDLAYEIIKQAKEMEKQQIIAAVEWNYKSNMGEVYYNATYKPSA